MFKSKTVTPAAVAEPEAIIEVIPEPQVTVVAIAPLSEGDWRYDIGQKFTTTEPRARRLTELNLVRPFDASAPPPPRLASARQSVAEANETLQTLLRQRLSVERDLKLAEEQTQTIRGRISGTIDAGAMEQVTSELTSAEQKVSTIRNLLQNVRSAIVQAEGRKAEAQRTIQQIENRVAELRVALIPAAQRTIEEQRREIAALRQKADRLEHDGIRNAQAEVGKLQDELKFLS